MLRLYTDILSQPCRAITILLKIANIPVDEVNVSFVKEETQTDWFSKINPMKCVPVMDDNGFVITESLAILKYICTKPTVSSKWYPCGEHKRALVDEYMAWQYTTGVRMQCGRVFIAQALIPHRSGAPVDMVQLGVHTKALNTALDQMESYFLSRGDFITGSEMTVADLSAVCELMQAITLGFPFTVGRPRLDAWFSRTSSQLQPYFADTHKAIINFCETYKRDNYNIVNT